MYLPAWIFPFSSYRDRAEEEKAEKKEEEKAENLPTRNGVPKYTEVYRSITKPAGAYGILPKTSLNLTKIWKLTVSNRKFTVSNRNTTQNQIRGLYY